MHRVFVFFFFFAEVFDVVCNVVEQVGFCGNASLTVNALLKLNRLLPFFSFLGHSS